MVCIGGETDKGFSTDVYLLQWDAKKELVVKKILPSLPFPLANAAATAVGNIIYVMGGENAEKVSDVILTLDLNSSQPTWMQSGTIPTAMSHSVAVAQSGNIYLIGGRTRTDSGISTLHSTTYCYNPADKSWNKLSPVHDAKSITNLSAASGVPVGKQHILVMGGDKGDLFNKIETFNANIAKSTTEDEKQGLQQEKVALLTSHPGFSKDVLLYNIKTDEWSVIGELPYSPVTTCAVQWNDQVFIPSGEVKPGRRTPEILKGIVKCKK
ncbi:N-acetylneuraminate epimerase precursor [compost metagenome]